MLESIKKHWKQSLITGLGYGLGMAVGIAIAFWSFQFVTVPEEDFVLDGSVLILGVLIAITLVGLGAALGGFIGGYTLPVFNRPKKRFGYAWRSALALGVPFGLIMFVLIFLVYTLSVTDSSGIDPWGMIQFFVFLGTLFGLIVGLLLGALTIGRQFMRIGLASGIGFGLGGIALGYGLWVYLGSIPIGGLLDEGENPAVFIISLFVFGLVGGTLLGFAYHRIHDRIEKNEIRSRIPRWARITLAIVGIALFVGVFWPFLSDVAKVLTPRDAGLSVILDSDAVDTHWSTPQIAAIGSVADPQLVSGQANNVALAWLEASDNQDLLKIAYGTLNSTIPQWQEPIQASTGAILSPQIALDTNGNAHMVWFDQEQAALQHTVCDDASCADAVQIATQSATCSDGIVSTLDAPALAIDGGDTIMLVWADGQNQLVAATWSADQSAESATISCIPSAPNTTQPRLAGHNGIGFTLVAKSGSSSVGQIVVNQHDGQQWMRSDYAIGSGFMPEVFVDDDNVAVGAWCSAESGLMFRKNARAQIASELPCLSRPSIALDNHGLLHILFASNTVQRPETNAVSRPVLYEVIETDDGWAPASIVATPDAITQATMTNSAEGHLLSSWLENGSSQSTIQVANKTQYDCDGYELEGAALAVFEVSEREKYRPPEDTLAYCRNQYNRFLFTPNPLPEFSDYPPAEDGVYIPLADIMRTAEYEVLFATMAYEGSHNGYGAGIVIGEAIADLYNDLKANPEKYPRGLTVRYLLGNSPKLELDSQLWTLLEDLREAGIPTMTDPEVGWRLEVANFEGSFPHSHTKLLVVDGKQAVSMGFNVEFKLMPTDHPSGKGKGDTDLGLHIIGPVAQDSRRAFDDLWDGAVRRHCDDFDPAFQVWQLTCSDSAASVDHVPEVMRYYDVDGDTTALSMFRNDAHDEADQGVYAIMDSVEESVDIMHVNFALPIECVVNHFFDVCRFDNALPYMSNWIDTIEEKGVKARVLLGVIPIQGVENTVAVRMLENEIDERGLNDLIEIRYKNGYIHAKTILVDDEFLVVGSQNLHAGAFGKDGGLTEYSLAIDNPQAIEEYKAYFQHYWDTAH